MAINVGDGRKIDYARISVTDRCNYRCTYCMPEDGVQPIPHEQVMRYEEISTLCNALWELGVKKIRFTGGEPLVRKGLVSFLKSLRHDLPDLAISITTNASLLSRYAKDLAEVGLSGMNISLDTVDPEKFRSITRVGDISDVVTGIDAACGAGIANIKTNTVLIRGFNDAELPRILNFAWERNIIPRVIEFMPLGDDVWKREKFIGSKEIMEHLTEFGDWTREDDFGEGTRTLPRGPAKYFVNKANGKRVGVIEAVSNHFCSDCNRLRITARGNMRACLFSRDEIPLLDIIRRGDMAALKTAIVAGVASKPDCWEDARDGKQRMSGIGG